MTRYALIADVHSNIEALDAVLAHARSQGASRRVFLGDLVGYGPDPAAVVARVRAALNEGDAAILGNHDAAISRNILGTMNEVARRSVTWTRAQLSDEALAFLGELPPLTQEEGMTWVHASAAEPERWAYIHDRDAAARSLRIAGTRWVFSGHVHDPALYCEDAYGRMSSIRPREDVPIPLPEPHRWLAIVGSCGQPRDGKLGARYALFDVARRELCFHRVPYDHAHTAAKIRAAGLPERLARHIEGTL